MGLNILVSPLIRADCTAQVTLALGHRRKLHPWCPRERERGAARTAWASCLLLQSWLHVLKSNDGYPHAGSAGVSVRLWCPQAALKSWQEQLQVPEPSPQHFSLRPIYFSVVTWSEENN